MNTMGNPSIALSIQCICETSDELTEPGCDQLAHRPSYIMETNTRMDTTKGCLTVAHLVKIEHPAELIFLILTDFNNYSKVFWSILRSLLHSHSASIQSCNRAGTDADTDAESDTDTGRGIHANHSRVGSKYDFKLTMGHNSTYRFRSTITELDFDPWNRRYESRTTCCVAQCTCTTTHLVEQLHDQPDSYRLRWSFAIIPNNSLGKLLLWCNEKRWICAEAAKQEAAKEST
mmetsp:Transcript_6922/g.18794  ORF Transcript_6922/g.18794 Transcript_6922/m.18794 type:complete len:232 (-) Transcript_6922:115-810(-)